MKKLYLSLFLIMATCATAGAAMHKTAPMKAGVTVKTPVVKAATDVTTTGFTANWEAVAGADVYQVTCYEPVAITAEGDYIVLSEGFNLVGIGTFQEPAYLDDFYIDFTEYNFTETPDWSGFLPVFARGMVSGVIYSPYIDLTADGGKFTVHLSITGYAGAQVQVTSNGSTEETKMLTLTRTGSNDFDVEFTNGTHDTFIVMTDFGIMDDPEGLYTDCFDFIDDFAVEQHFKAGETFLRLVEVGETDIEQPATSWRFEDMKFQNGASHLAYDVMAISVVYTDPEDPYEYDTYYSDYSPLEHVILGAGVEGIEADGAAPAEYFNLQGVRVEGDLAPGIYIRRQGTKVEKIKL